MHSKLRELSQSNVKSTPEITTFKEAGWIDLLCVRSCTRLWWQRLRFWEHWHETSKDGRSEVRKDWNVPSTRIILDTVAHVRKLPQAQSQRWSIPARPTTAPGCSTRGRATVMEADVSQGSPWSSFTICLRWAGTLIDFLLDSNSAWLHTPGQKQTLNIVSQNLRYDRVTHCITCCQSVHFPELTCTVKLS